jgi:hypothetical protein
MPKELLSCSELLSWLKKKVPTLPSGGVVTFQEAMAAFSHKEITHTIWDIARAAMGDRYRAIVLDPNTQVAKKVPDLKPKKNSNKEDLSMRVCRVLSSQTWLSRAQVEVKIGETISKDTYNRAQLCVGGNNAFQKELYQDILKTAHWLLNNRRNVSEMTPELVSQVTSRVSGLRYVKDLRNNPFFLDAVNASRYQTPAAKVAQVQKAAPKVVAPPKVAPQKVVAVAAPKPATLDYTVVARIKLEPSSSVKVIFAPDGRYVEIRNKVK